MPLLFAKRPVEQPNPPIRWSVFFLDIVCLLILAGVASILGATLTTRTDFYVTPGDPSLSYPEKPDIIPTWANILLSIVGPLVLMPLITLVSGLIFDRHIHWILELRGAWLGLLYSSTFAGLVTGIIKHTIGRPRPTFFSSVTPSESQYESLPSGHTMTAFVGFTYLTLFFMGKMHVLTSHKSTRLFSLTIALLVFSIALVVGLSRYYDYSHHLGDVIVGAAIGFLVSYVTYFAFYPPLSKKNAHAALPL